MWLLRVLPDWIFYAVVLAGAAGLVSSIALRFLPFIDKFALPIKMASIVSLLLGVYMIGAINNEEHWKQKVAEAEYRAKQAEQEGIKENTKIETRVVEKIKVVDGVRTVVQKEIVEKMVEINSKCEVSPTAIELINKAATARE